MPNAHEMQILKNAAALRVLRRARPLIAAGWTQYAFAKDDVGATVNSSSPNAVCWCSLGAINASIEMTGEYDAAKNVLSRVAGENIGVWNDAPGRTQAEVLALFDRAIAECESQVSMTAREGE